MACLGYLILSAGAICQNTIGLPEIINYSNEDYHGGSQTWSGQQGQNGILYFANNDGVPSFDGNYWKHYSLPTSKEISQLMNISVRGVEIARYRLRKKLQLSTDENLSDLLIAIRTE